MGLFEKIKSVSSTPSISQDSVNNLTGELKAQPYMSPETSELINGVQNGTVDVNSLTQKLSEQAGISLSGEDHYGYEIKKGWEDNYNKSHSGSGEVIPGARVSGEISQEVNIFAGAYGKGGADIEWDSEQPSIHGRAFTQSVVGVEATEKTSVKGSLDIEGIDHDLGVDANSQTRAFVGSKIEAETDVILSKDNVHGGLRGKAFTGIEVEKKLDGSLSVDGDSFARAEAHGGGKVGIGAELNADVGYRDGQINVEMGLGAAFGVGASGGFKGSIDAPGILTHPEDVLKSVIETPGIISHPQAVAESAVSTVENLGDTIARVADIFPW
jgi:hypothetical protein